MSSDSVFALVVLGLLLLVVTVGQFSLKLLEFMMMSRSVSTVVLLLAVVGLYYKNLVYTALAFAVLAVFLLKDLWAKYPGADVRRLTQETARDLARFDANQSVDLQWGNRTVKHDSPRLGVTPKSRDGLLVFPPSEEVLYSMCG
jgi:lysylphosphatidylglycerol synthetase-like protein (DUF2156 family)